MLLLFLWAFILGALSISAWIDVRWPGLRPKTPRRLLLCLALGFISTWFVVDIITGFLSIVFVGLTGIWLVRWAMDAYSGTRGR